MDREYTKASRERCVFARGFLARVNKTVTQPRQTYLQTSFYFKSYCSTPLKQFRLELMGEQLVRGIETTTLCFKNVYLQHCNISVMNEHMVFVTCYHKSQTQMDKPKVISRR
jgi:hypothetical protein